jgi:hypothetical protein
VRLASGYFRLEQVERGAFDRERGKPGLCPAGVLLAGIPANGPARSDLNVAAIGSGDPAFARDHQEELRSGRRMRADNATRLERQAGQTDLAFARRDARGRQSLTTVQLDVLFRRSNWKISTELLS